MNEIRKVDEDLFVKHLDWCERAWATVYLEAVAGRESGSRPLTETALRLRMADRIAIVPHTANSLVLLGLIGRVIGFIIALSGVQPGMADDIRAVSPVPSPIVTSPCFEHFAHPANIRSSLGTPSTDRLCRESHARLEILRSTCMHLTEGWIQSHVRLR